VGAGVATGTTTTCGCTGVGDTGTGVAATVGGAVLGTVVGSGRYNAAATASDAATRWSWRVAVSASRDADAPRYAMMPNTADRLIPAVTIFVACA
jgi:hypothetical protein